jgi:hypothetical protein
VRLDSLDLWLFAVHGVEVISHFKRFYYSKLFEVQGTCSLSLGDTVPVGSTVEVAGSIPIAGTGTVHYFNVIRSASEAFQRPPSKSRHCSAPWCRNNRFQLYRRSLPVVVHWYRWHRN